MTPLQERALKFTRNNEDSTGKGVVTNDPVDKGGMTKWGITDTLARKHRKNVISLTLSEADEIMLREFWRWDKIHHEDIAVRLFDYAVNSGTMRAVVHLQLALNNLGFQLEVDGKLGPVTVTAANRADGEGLMRELRQEREKFLRGIVRRDPGQGKWLNGWLNRNNREIPA